MGREVIMKIKGLGRLLLGILLLIYGIQPFLVFTIPHREEVMAVLALVAGIFIILER